MSGVWQPIEWTSKPVKLLYGMFTCFTIYLLNFSMMTQLMDIVLVVDNIDDFTTTSLMFLTAVSAFCKAVTAVIRRDEIINLVKILQDKPCKPDNDNEINIQMKYNRLRSYSISYTLLASFSATGAIVGEIFAVLKGELPYRGWVPYDTYNSFVNFLLTSLQEMLALIFGTIVNIASETLVLGFCLQTCAQFEILKCRLEMVTKSTGKEDILEKSLNRVSNRTNRLSEHIRHHLCIIRQHSLSKRRPEDILKTFLGRQDVLWIFFGCILDIVLSGKLIILFATCYAYIYRFAEMANDIFSQVLFIQFFGSILICSTVYYLTSHMTVIDFVKLVIYTFCMFVQIFVYCWAGNESTGLSEAIYHIDWMLLTISEQKDLLMIMKRSTRPIKFTSSFLVTLSLDSYTNILKTSYSAFNLLQEY